MFVLIFAIALATSLLPQTSSLGSSCKNQNLPRSKQTEYWLAAIKRQGTAPFNPNPGTYKVWRNVKDFGAKGDGKTDDTQAINSAISSGNRCGLNCGESTLAPAIVYFPAGQYLVSASVFQYYYTQFIGDPLNPPTLVMAANFNGPKFLIEANPNQHWSGPINFYRGIRNMNLDTTHGPSSAVALHWDVAQATFINNVNFKLSRDAGTQQIGIQIDYGSGGHMSDLTFDGGRIGFSGKNQQFTIRNIAVSNAETAIHIFHNWGWTFKGVNITNCKTGVDLTGGDVASLLILDARISNTDVGFKISNSATSNPSSAGTFLIDNIHLDNVKSGVLHSNGKVLLAGGTKVVKQWASGHVYQQSGSHSFVQGDVEAPTKSQVLLDSNGYFFEKAQPLYDDVALDDFISVKDEGAKGDGKTDDTAAIQQALNKWAGCKVIFFPAGYYVVSDTVAVPAGTRIAGELWPTILVTGAKFGNLHDPKVVFQIGKPGEQGVAEISDLIFSNAGPVAGAIIVQINMKDPQNERGAVGLWNSHFRIGGALSTKQLSCTRSQNKPECIGAFLMLHIAPTGSAYLENVWAWLADHHLDPNGPGQVSIYNGRGILAESANGPVWMYGTASEHNVLYQYQVSNAKNVYMGFIQTETPYYQPTPAAPAPFVTNASFTDPDFSRCGTTKGCPFAYGLRIVSSENVYVYGAGLYNFFNSYTQNCIGSATCQDVMVEVDKTNHNVHIFNLNTIASKSMVAVDGQPKVDQGDNRSYMCSSIAAINFQ